MLIRYVAVEESYRVVGLACVSYRGVQLQALRELALDLCLTQSQSDRALRAMMSGTIAMLLDNGMAPTAVIDLVPVKPLAQVEPTLESAYRTGHRIG